MLRSKLGKKTLSFERLEDRSLCSVSPTTSTTVPTADTSSSSALVASSTSTSTAYATASATPTGVYALIQNLKSIPSSVLSNSNVDGVALYLAWYNVEQKGDNVYKWSYLDNQIAAARNAGKKVSLSIMAGTWTPDWVYGKGAQSFTYVDKKSSTQHKIPVPWDTVYLKYFTEFLKAVGARYGNNPAISDIKITGVNPNTQETALPRSTGQKVTSNGQTWYTTNDVQHWMSIGYTTTKVENAWLRIADVMYQYFPGKSITGIFYPGSFPPIDANGQRIANQSGNDALIYDMVAKAEAKYGSRFVLQNDGMSSTWMWPALTNQPSNVRTGAQMVWSVTDDPSGRMNGHHPGYDPATVLKDTVNDALAGGLDFLEFYLNDIQNPDLSSVIAYAHNGLT